MEANHTKPGREDIISRRLAFLAPEDGSQEESDDDAGEIEHIART